MSDLKHGPPLHTAETARLRFMSVEEYVEDDISKAKTVLCYRVLVLDKQTGELRIAWPRATPHLAAGKVDEMAANTRGIAVAVARMRKKGVVKVV